MRLLVRRFLVTIVAAGFALLGTAKTARAQALGWEGETGVFVTPLAYTAASETDELHPVVGYHYLNAGWVIGDFHEISITAGFLKRFEVGYTHEYHTQGSNPSLSPLWQNGFEIFHGKAMVISENKENWTPAIAIGFMVRENVRNVGNLKFTPDGGISATDNGKSNQDVYVVATKSLSQLKLPVIVSAGVRGTNAQLWGMGGNAPDWEARAFGSIAVPVKLRGESTIIFASEFAQQPKHPDNFPKLNIPTTLTYAARFVPNSKYRFNVDVGVAQIAGRVAAGTDLKARHQVGVQISYGF